jgi:hypothetical protein
MADLGQQPTAVSEVLTLVNDIFDMISDMKIRKSTSALSDSILPHYYMKCPPYHRKSLQSACANVCHGCRRQCKMTAMQPRLTSQTVRLRQRPLATHMVKLKVKLKVNNRVEATVENNRVESTVWSVCFLFLDHEMVLMGIYVVSFLFDLYFLLLLFS